MSENILPCHPQAQPCRSPPGRQGSDQRIFVLDGLSGGRCAQCSSLPCRSSPGADGGSSIKRGSCSHRALPRRQRVGPKHASWDVSLARWKPHMPADRAGSPATLTQRRVVPDGPRPKRRASLHKSGIKVPPLKNTAAVDAMPKTNTHKTADVVGADKEERVMREGRESRCDEGGH
jgi:hypothetical protein